jgi:hypothetical protein
VPKAHLHFKAKRRTGDYHGSMLEPAFGSLTAEACRNIFTHVRKEEERYWEVDEQLDEIVSSG